MGNFIDDDLTPEQKEIQKEIVSYAATQREQGERIKIGYQKVHIDNEMLIWKKGLGLVKDKLFR